MKIHCHHSLLIGMILIALPVHMSATSDTTLPEAGILPDNPLYIFDLWLEEIGTFLTFGEEYKVQRYIERAEERLAEARALDAGTNSEYITETTKRYEEHITKAQDRAASATGDLEVVVTEATTRHLTVLDEVMVKVPEQARESIQAAKDRAITSQIESLRRIAERNPEKSVEMVTEATKKRLESIQAHTTQELSTSAEAKRVEQMVGEYRKYLDFSQEIVPHMQSGATQTQELLRRNTVQSLDVLREVETKVPQEAKDSIERALQQVERIEQTRPTSSIPGDIPTRPSAERPEPRMPERMNQVPDGLQE